MTERAHGYNRNSARARCHTIAVACEQSILHLHAVSVLRGVQSEKERINFLDYYIHLRNHLRAPSCWWRLLNEQQHGYFRPTPTYSRRGLQT